MKSITLPNKSSEGFLIDGEKVYMDYGTIPGLRPENLYIKGKLVPPNNPGKMERSVTEDQLDALLHLQYTISVFRRYPVRKSKLFSNSWR